MNKLPPFREYMIEDGPKPGSRWWHWSPGIIKKRAKNYDDKVRRAYGLSEDVPIPETLRTISSPQPQPDTGDDEYDLLDLPCIIYANPNAPVVRKTWLYRAKYSNTGMFIRHSILEPVSGKLVDFIACMIIGPLYLLFPLYHLVALPFRTMEAVNNRILSRR